MLPCFLDEHATRRLPSVHPIQVEIRAERQETAVSNAIFQSDDESALRFLGRLLSQRHVDVQKTSDGQYAFVYDDDCGWSSPDVLLLQILTKMTSRLHPFIVAGNIFLEFDWQGMIQSCVDESFCVTLRMSGKFVYENQAELLIEEAKGKTSATDAKTLSTSLSDRLDDTTALIEKLQTRVSRLHKSVTKKETQIESIKREVNKLEREGLPYEGQTAKFWHDAFMNTRAALAIYKNQENTTWLRSLFRRSRSQ